MRPTRYVTSHLQEGVTRTPHLSASDPIWHLLRGLRSRTVTLLVDGRRLKGKLIKLDPITIASPKGEAIIVRLEAIKAVIF